MNKAILYISVSLCAAAGFQAAAQDAPKLRKDNVKEVLSAMTLEEKATLVVGQGMAGFHSNTATIGSTEVMVPGAAGTTAAIPRLGIPSIVVADGPAGLRISPYRTDTPDRTYYCTHFPVATLLACTWNPEVVMKVGEAMGDEVKEYGVDLLLGPALNIHRNPLCGRNFEYYSEDPYLSGKTASAMVKGIQSNGVGTSIKHFAVNNQEINRMHVDAILSQRALREIYLRGFEMAVKESVPWTIMSSYNLINGVEDSQSRDLLRDITRDEWGFKGLVMTDWGGGAVPAAQMHAGNDLLMPGYPKQTQAIVDAVNNGSLAVEDLDFCVENMLNLIVRTPRFNGYKYSNSPDLKAHAQVTREAAGEGMVLLKNSGNALPFSKEIRRIALFGVTSYDFIAGGTGSGDVNRAYTVDLRQGLLNAGYEIEAELEKDYLNYIKVENDKFWAKQDKNNPMIKFVTIPRPEEKIFENGFLDATAASADIAVLTIGRNSGEGCDRSVENDFKLTDAEKALMWQVKTAYAKAGKKVIVVLNIGGVIETASWKNVPDAVLLAWQGGQEGGNAVADILRGEVNPSGKLSMTWPVSYFDHWSSRNFPWNFNVKESEKLALFFGSVPRTDDKPMKDVDYTYYEEDVYVGYRYFDSFGKDVSYPFGFGLSYTTFEFSDASLIKNGNGWQVNVKVTNTGKCPGKEVAQVYASSPSIAVGRPAQELVAYGKTDLLAPGESQTLTLDVTRRDLAWYNAEGCSWTLEKGKYVLKIGTSSRDIKSELSFDIPMTEIIEETHNSLPKKKKINLIFATD